jgi:hypothetical protein
MTKRKSLDPRMLAQFTGSTHFYRHGLVREVLYTEGVEYVSGFAGHLSQGLPLPRSLGATTWCFEEHQEAGRFRLRGSRRVLGLSKGERSPAE